MTSSKLTTLAVALAAAFPLAVPTVARAQSTADLLKELEALKARVGELEKKLQESQAKPAPGQWGMTPEQAAEFNRIAVKTEATEDNLEAWGFKGLTISGYMDPTFIYNKRQDRAGFQFLNRVDDDGYNYDNSYFGAAVLDFQKETESGTRWRLTLAPNRGVGAVIDGASPVHEASVSIPLTDLQTRLIAGQIPDWSGYEYLQPTLNPLITHNLLFDFTLPTAYTGAGVEITRGKWITKAVLANMNATRRVQGEQTPVIAYRVDYSRGEFQGFGFAGVHGKAANFTENVVDSVTGEVIAQPDSRVDLFEVDGYFIRGDLTVQGQVSFGQQKKASITPDPVTGELRDARWWGVSGLVGYNFQPRLKGIVRLDYLENKKNGGGLLGYTAADDRNGIGPDPAGDPEKGANRMALSLGVSYLYNMNTTFKAEYRLDRANIPVFLDVKDGTYAKDNHLLGASVLVAF
jgi:hypothetical protein